MPNNNALVPYHPATAVANMAIAAATHDTPLTPSQINALWHSAGLNVLSAHFVTSLPQIYNLSQAVRIALDVNTGRDAQYIPGTVTLARVQTFFPTVVAGVVIQTRGREHRVGPCRACRRNKRHLTGPFTECRRLVGHFNDNCGNCRFRGNNSDCIWDAREGALDNLIAVLSNSDSDFDDSNVKGKGKKRARRGEPKQEVKRVKTEPGIRQEPEIKKELVWID